MVALLCAHGVALDYCGSRPGDTALHFAVTYGDVHVVKVLLDAGASVDIAAQSTRPPRTPRETAEKKKLDEIVKLIDARIEKDKKNSSATCRIL